MGSWAVALGVWDDPDHWVIAPSLGTRPAWTAEAVPAARSYRQHILGTSQILWFGAVLIAGFHGISAILKVRSAKIWNKTCLMVG